MATASQGTSSIATYFSKLHELWAEFDCLAPAPGCDCPKSSEYEVFLCRQKLLQFLMGLNETYEQAREQIMMMDPLPTVNKAYSMLMERESQRSMANAVVPAENVEMTALLTTKGFNNQKPRRNYNVLFSPPVHSPILNTEEQTVLNDVAGIVDNGEDITPTDH
ncbi:hypothetical protein A4A49_54567 [Nicotiana attenuata]|uniref:Retrotransposon gag domain-containing protein n=1 Tax=Nicotiana attenuata TaxID=49451 RepID=A0A1J6JVT8_NICAT|nr:hypothetical protein A4A49_54567 [Nicotiana attenuata]